MEQNLIIHKRHLPAACYSYSSTGAPKAMEDYSGIVQHFFSGRWTFPEDKYNLEKCWQLMHDLNFETEQRKYNLYHGPRVSASAHYMIGRCGTILELVPLAFRAFHAGKSEFEGRRDCNRYMIGIENLGTEYDDYTAAQYIANAKLCKQLMLMHPNIKLNTITGHEDICVPPGRKKDPGEHFDWPMLRAMIDNNYEAIR